MYKYVKISISQLYQYINILMDPSESFSSWRPIGDRGGRGAPPLLPPPAQMHPIVLAPPLPPPRLLSGISVPPDPKAPATPYRGFLASGHIRSLALLSDLCASLCVSVCLYVYVPSARF